MLRIETDVDVKCRARVEVELRGREREAADSNGVLVSLLAVVFILLTEELKAAVTASVDATESHIDSVT